MGIINKKNIKIIIIIIYLAVLGFITYSTLKLIIEYKKIMFINSNNIQRQEYKISEINMQRNNSIDYWNKVFLIASIDRNIAILKVSETVVFINFLIILGELLLLFPVILWFFNGLLLRLK